MNVERRLDEYLKNFFNNADSPRCLLASGPSGCMKTQTLRSLVHKLGYSEIYFSSLETNLLDSIRDLSNNLVSSYSVCDLLRSNCTRRQVVIIDNIDAMRLNDPGCFSALTRLVRKKRTKKQKREEEFNRVPIICIGSSVRDKKTRELAKSCVEIDFGVMHSTQGINNSYGDLIDLLFERELSPLDLQSLTSQCDTTVLSMIWHENIVKGLGHIDADERILKYLEVLETLSFCDSIDKIAFSKQTWELAEASGMLKLLGTSRSLHKVKCVSPEDRETRFTKILTKYSTAHNIRSFVVEISNLLNVDAAELNALVREVKDKGEKGALSSVDDNDITRLCKYIS